MEAIKPTRLSNSEENIILVTCFAISSDCFRNFADCLRKKTYQTFKMFRACVKDAVLTETDIAAFVTVPSRRNSDSLVQGSGNITRPYLRMILSMLWQPKAIGAEAQLGPGCTHVKGRAA